MLSYGIRWWGLAFIGFLVCTVSFMTFMGGHGFAALAVLLILPSLPILSFGSFRSRLLNALPLLALSAGLYLGFRYGEWVIASRLFFALPFIGLLVKPRRHPLKYVTLGVSVVSLITDYAFGWSFPWAYRILIIIWIYIIFLPPVIVKYLRRLRYRVMTFTAKGQ